MLLDVKPCNSAETVKFSVKHRMLYFVYLYVFMTSLEFSTHHTGEEWKATFFCTI